MDAYIKKLNTGDTLVFDRAARELFLLDAQSAQSWSSGEADSLSALRRMAEEGRVHRFDRPMLERIQAALAQVVLLEA